MKISFLITSIILAATAASHASSPITTVNLDSTLTSANGLVTVYEGSDILGFAKPAISGSGEIGAIAPSGNVYYYVDIVGDSNQSIAGIAVSFNDPFSTFTSLGASLGSTTTLLGLATGVYDSSHWSTLSSIPFATAFGPTDNRFIWIAGTVAITKTNDVDGTSLLTTANAHAIRTGSTASSFVALGSGGSIISGSLVPEPSSALLLVMGVCGVTLHRRRACR